VFPVWCKAVNIEQKIMVPVNCCGITLIDNDIVLGNRGEICITNREGQRLNTIKVGKGMMYSLYCGMIPVCFPSGVKQ
jgi:hypothetical protein